MIVFYPGAHPWDLARTLPWLTLPIIILTALCAAIIVGSLLVSWALPGGIRVYAGGALAIVGSAACCKLITRFIYVERPFVLDHFTPFFPHSADASFPSSTVAYCTAGAVILALRYPRSRIVAGAWALEIAFGCVYVGVHYGTDVLAGLAIGTACGLAAWMVTGLPVFSRSLRRTERFFRHLHLLPRATAHATPPPGYDNSSKGNREGSPREGDDDG